MTYDIIQGEEGKADYTPYGGVRDFIVCKEPEVIVSGPAETGKTLGALWKLHLCACKYPGSSLVICRKTLTSVYSTVLVTFRNQVLSNGAPVKPYGGEKPQWFDYANGSRIWVAGLDKAGKVLSAEHDIIYVNQTEEITLEDWEILTTRTTGRAGNMPYAQTIGDINPAWPKHWIYHRDSLKVFYSYHPENPLLYDQETGEITEQGRRTMRVLDALTGVRRTRLRDGLPSRAEGMVYDEWEPTLHLIDAEGVSQRIRRWLASVDWGYTNPGVIQVWGEDYDGRLYRIHEVYRVEKTIDWWADKAVDLKKLYPRIEVFVCDPSEPGHMAKFEQEGLKTEKAKTSISDGIQAVQERMKTAGDGKPRIFFVRGALEKADPKLELAEKPTCAEDEVDGYVWPKDVSGKPLKEAPVKVDDHGMDTTRYAVMYVDRAEKRKKVRAWGPR